MKNPPTLRFFGVGPQRTASSWLHQMLIQQPGVSFPQQVKETMFFDQHYSKGIDWYLWHFRESPADSVLGEIGPTYFDDEDARKRIKDHFPDARIIISIRDPITRSHSLFRHHLSKGRVPNSFQSAVENMPRILTSGKYADYCPAWESDFSGRICYVHQEDVETDPAAVLQNVCQFLSVDLKVIPDAAREKANSAVAPRSAMLARMSSMTATLLRSMRLHGLVELGKRMGLKSIYRGGADTDPLTNEIHDFLVEYYRADIQWLEKKFQRDYSSWLKFDLS